MALQISLTAEQTSIGAAFDAAYARIVASQYEIKTDDITIVVEVHVDNYARRAGKMPIDVLTFKAKNGTDTADLDSNPSEGVRRILYTYLKTLPEFQVSVDV